MGRLCNPVLVSSPQIRRDCSPLRAGGAGWMNRCGEVPRWQPADGTGAGSPHSVCSWSGIRCRCGELRLTSRRGWGQTWKCGCETIGWAVAGETAEQKGRPEPGCSGPAVPKRQGQALPLESGLWKEEDTWSVEWPGAQAKGLLCFMRAGDLVVGRGSGDIGREEFC